MIPLKAERPVHLLPWVNIFLIAANITVFLFFNLSLSHLFASLPREAGFVPHNLFHLLDGSFQEALKTAASVATAMFLHGGWLHLLGNMLYLFVFGDNVEERLGHRRYLIFYFLCGAVAALTHAGFYPDSKTPVVGASGAVAGVLGAYFLFFPATRVKTLLFFGIFVRITAVPAALLLGIWALLQIASALLSDGASAIAWYAHIGGFAAGLLAAVVLRPRRA
jgi:membrane associated rhomboid family serine protease